MSSSAPRQPEDAGARPVRCGIDRVAAGEVELDRTARLGLLTNRSARTVDGTWTGEALGLAGYRVTLLLSPEHGLDAKAEAGAPVPHSRQGPVPVLSLYGADPSRIDEALREVEALVVDLRDVGCRYYTYPWTVRELLRRAARHALPVTLLDRPNPLGGAAVEGSVPDPGLDSPVCASPVPVRHGLTMGELALWNHSAHAIGANLSVVPMAGWRRSMLWDGTGLAWVAPSPALPSVEAALVYPGTCLLEGTNVSEGRGTDKPFQVLGAPFLDAAALVARLSASGHLVGAALTETSFTPASSKWAGQTCRGVRIEVRDAGVFRPVAAGVAIVAALCRHAGFEFRPSQFDALAGTGAWRRSLEQGAPAEEIVGRWRTDEAGFWRERAGILLY